MTQVPYLLYHLSIQFKYFLLIEKLCSAGLFEQGLWVSVFFLFFLCGVGIRKVL